MSDLLQGDLAQSEPRRRVKAPRFSMAIPAWVWFILFFVIPVLWIAYYSLGYKPNFFTTIATDKLSFAQYGTALSGTFLTTFRNTLQISILGTILCLIIGFPFAYWLAVRVPPRWRGLLLGLVIVPFWTNFLIRTIGWRILLSANGPLATLMNDLGLHNGQFAILDTKFAVQLGVVYNYLPLMILPVFVALDRLDPAMREASKDLGASRLKTFRQVTVPLAFPGVVAGALLVFIPLTGDYITAAVLGGAKGNMVGRMVADQFLVAQNWALGSAMAIVLIGMIMLVVAIFGALGLAGRALIRRNRRVTLEGVPA